MPYKSPHSRSWRVSHFFYSAFKAVSGRSRKHGQLYVFETLIGFVTKAFGIKTHEAFPFAQVAPTQRPDLCSAPIPSPTNEKDAARGAAR